MTLKARIEQDMKSAMRAKDGVRLDAIRMLRAAIQRLEVDERIELDDQRVLAVIQKLIKQGQDAATQFQAGNRDDLVDKEQRQIDVFNTYLPDPLKDSEIDDLVRTAVADVGANSIRDMGKVMGILKPKLQGRVDMAVVSRKVQDSLQS